MFDYASIMRFAATRWDTTCRARAMSHHNHNLYSPATHAGYS
jgi:hypothetical protein